ncbi:uncharacterized protein LOC129565888 [Sitodiplosis mosellana]|uniref:uncharacterized protein LOC129565888 n=1 Tax=Sitodiplosis mosellana TaxID=263140 RepID=UPI0024439F26|nr:uncharacterized protein LOC129565888 [Sitodiplosis mosellana]
MEDMQCHLNVDIKRLGYETKQFYLGLENTTTVDINVLLGKLSDARKKLLQISHHELKKFGKEFEEMAAKLNINLSTECKRKYANHIKLFEFLQSVSNIDLSYSFHVSDGLKDLKDYLEKSYSWYNFLIALHDNLSAYDVQKHKTEYMPRSNEIIKCCETQTRPFWKIDDIELKHFARDVGCKVQYNALDNIRLNPYKLNALKLVLEQTLKTRLEIDCTQVDKLVIKGYNVKISDVIEMNLPKIHIEVFALNNLFIDVDIIKTGQDAQVSLIALKWFIIGDRQINLNGKDGEPYLESPAETSKDGIPGRPGGAAGNFFGIGKKCFCDKNLKIYLNGGKGGPGQAGAKGADGIKGEPAPTPSFFMVNPWGNKYQNDRKIRFDFGIFGKHSYDVVGKTGTEPGDGGKGGHGGYGSNAGKYKILFFDREPNFSISQEPGHCGCAGKGGNGGSPAENDVVEAEYIHVLYFLNFFSNILSKGPNNLTKSGQNGEDGGNSKNMERPVPPNSFHNEKVVKEYVDWHLR